MEKPLWLPQQLVSIQANDVGLNQIRIAYVLKKEDLIRSVEILRRALKEYQD